MAGLVLRVSTILVALLFIVAGGLKLYPPTTEMAENIMKSFEVFTEVFPTIPLGYKPSAANFLFTVSLIEFLSGLGILLGPATVKRLCCLPPMVIMVGACYTLAKTGDLTGIPMTLISLLGLIYVYHGLGQTKAKND